MYANNLAIESGIGFTIEWKDSPTVKFDKVHQTYKSHLRQEICDKMNIVVNKEKNNINIKTINFKVSSSCKSTPRIAIVTFSVDDSKSANDCR